MCSSNKHKNFKNTWIIIYGKNKSVTHSFMMKVRHQRESSIFGWICCDDFRKTLKKTTFKPLWKNLVFQFQGLRSPLKPYFVQDLRFDGIFFSSNISVAVFHIERVLQSEIMTVFYQRSRPFFQSAPSPNMDEQFEHVVRVESCHKLKGLESSKQERVSSMIHYFAQMLTLKRVHISKAI